MDLELSGRAALLIGASRGIGGAAAISLSREGCKVAVVARTPAAVEERARLCRAAGAPFATGIAADATDPRQLEAAIASAAGALGGIDILVTLVGGSQPGGTEDTDDAGWEAAFARNLWPAVRASRLALPHLAQAGTRGRTGTGGVIVHVASILGREGGGPLTYNVAKAALISLAHGQARELAPRGVRVCSIGPGAVLHPGGTWERRMQRDPEGTTAYMKREIPFGRFGTAEEIGDAIAFLCSARASWIAGTCVVVDGAQSRSF
jgi:3-oxoacyl-[acyl-carrier protein] reductase